MAKPGPPYSSSQDGLLTKSIAAPMLQADLRIHDDLEAGLAGDPAEMIVLALEPAVVDRRHEEGGDVLHVVVEVGNDLGERLEDRALDEHEAGAGIVDRRWSLPPIEILDQRAILPGGEPLLLALFHGVNADGDVGGEVPQRRDVGRPVFDVGVDPEEVREFLPV